MSELTLLTGDCRELLPTLPERSVQCVITSPPYLGLRDYGTATWKGGAVECDHKQTVARHDGGRSNVNGFHGSARADSEKGAMNYRALCGKCGARRIDAQIGLEQLHDCLAWARSEPPCSSCYVCTLRAVFTLVWRVLRDDGVVFLNLGDSYMSGGGSQNAPGGIVNQPGMRQGNQTRPPKLHSLKPKDLIGIPWRVALALQADGWWLRSDVIWSKPNPMPESVTDRPTRSHEYVFVLSKSANYYWDQEAVREPHKAESIARYEYGLHTTADPNAIKGSLADRRQAGVGSAARMGDYMNPNGRNLRSVWTIATAPFSGAHFATFPPALVERCLLAGTSPQACEVCGAPWARVVERDTRAQREEYQSIEPTPKMASGLGVRNDYATRKHGLSKPGWRNQAPDTMTTTGWHATCRCENTGSARCTVLDPFAGSGTVGRVAIEHNRNAVLIDLSSDYAELQLARTNGIQRRLWLDD